MKHMTNTAYTMKQLSNIYVANPHFIHPNYTDVDGSYHDVDDGNMLEASKTGIFQR